MKLRFLAAGDRGELSDVREMIPDIGGAEVVNGIAKASLTIKGPVRLSRIECVHSLAGRLLDGPPGYQTVTPYFFRLIEGLNKIPVFFHSISRSC